MMLAADKMNAAMPQATPFSGARQAARPARVGRLHAAEVKSAETSTKAGGKEAIYIGHEKTDYEGKRSGSQGRFIMDDPSKYPAKEDMGFFLGMTGGWAGGEVGLKQFTKDVPPTAPKSAWVPPVKGEAVTTPTGKKAAVQTVGKGDDIIYVGYGKEDIEVRKTGLPGRFIRDDARKYPSKESIGPLSNVAGGFAGGELGVKQFASEGELKLATADGRRQTPSPLIYAGGVALFGTLGGLLLNSATDVTESVVAGDLNLAPLDEQTRLLLTGAIGLLGVTATVAGARIFARKAAEGIASTASTAAKFAAFWVVLFIAAKFVLEN